MASYADVIVNSTIPDNDTYTGVTKSVQVTHDLIIEHVEVTVNIPNFFFAGDLVVILTSPHGTKSVLAEQHGDGYAIFLSIPAVTDEIFLCGGARFGPSINESTISGEIVIPQPSSFGCNNITNCADLQGKIALVDYTQICNATLQVFNAQECGAILVLVSYRYAGPAFTLPSGGASLYNFTIPSAMIPFEAGMLLKDVIEQNGNVSINIGLEYYRSNITFDGWTFSTVRNWGENSKGNWTLQVFDTLYGAEAHFASYTMNIYGHSKPFLLPYWVVGIIVAFVVVVIFIVSLVLWVRNKNRTEGYRQMP